VKGLFRIALVVVLTGAGFLGGFAVQDLMRGKAPSAAAFKSLSTGGRTAAPTPTEIFKQNYSFIQANYYRSVKPDDLKFAAMEGLFSSLGDPHTMFMRPKLAEAFNVETRGDLIGIGARLNGDPLGAKVFSTFADGPAKEAGVKAGDIISAVDGKRIDTMPLDDAVALIRGKSGTKVRLTILREGQPRPFDLEVLRRMVIVPSVDALMTKSGVAVISITQFSEPTTAQFQRALADLLPQKPKGIVIDLRSNPGGLLNVAADMLGFFVSDKLVVTQVGRDKNEETRTPGGRTMKFGMPVVLLVNEDSASAAEIFTGVLRDYKIGTVVGEHSYGKASVQTVRPLSDGSSMKVTIAKYLLPNGQDIGRKVDEDGQFLKGGIIPEVEVALKLTPATQVGVPGKDSQLDRAIEVALGRK
jgi:carboxyl-terminal processing protease